MSKWELRYGPRAAKALGKLDKSVARRIRSKLQRLTELEDPTDGLKPLSGPLAGLYRLRVGDWRVLVDVQSDALMIVAVDLGHRSGSIYD
ncbi:type II toxin-antitoxin system RelE family toxin [Nesterenkonia alba]|uniref:type II toxin-antitoxin system RelE family toxin n=1 Tax=Nesterenkonia alba TaxID=515814 RepID=UPI0003B78E0C|nr:type II toxin-antitoxin system RelE/ParE family toxin [Nesterenkonia alba]